MDHPCNGCLFAQRKRGKFFKILLWCRLYKLRVEGKCVDFKSCPK